ncbi:MAG: molecular chaperone DnaJ [Propionibacteriaceae bacterium]|nr:molecular chaperone DnaJ [Propionibacteriaceae bacterium]
MSTKDWVEKDYYKILGVSKDASAEEIKKAFRKIARDNHPDQNPDNKKAEARFKEASEANAVLSDPAKRKEYDEARSLFGGGFRFPRGGGATPNMDDLFSGGAAGGFGDLFGNLFGQATQQTRRPSSGRGPRRGADVEGEATIDFAQAVDGTTVSLHMTSDAACSSCRGTGAKSGTVPRVCPTCEGSGMQTSTSGGVFAVTEPCAGCRGRGLVVDDPCPACQGSGRGRSSKTMQVRVPAGVTDGQKIRIKGKGGSGENGGAPGDLYVVVHVRPHRIFGRKGDNLTLTAPVAFTEASLGAEIQVPTLGGPSVTLKVPPGTPNGRTFRVRGKGIPRKDGTRGDLLVTVDVQVPTDLNEDARKALKDFSAAVGMSNPRSGLFHG